MILSAAERASLQGGGGDGHQWDSRFQVAGWIFLQWEQQELRLRETSVVLSPFQGLFLCLWNCS